MQEQQEPGQLIIPHDSNDPGPPASGQPEPKRPDENQDIVPPQPALAPEPQQPVELARPAQDTGWQFREETPVTASTTSQQLPAALNWTASEFIAHEKGAGWYGLLGGGALAVAAIVYVVTRDKISTGVVLFVAIMLGVFGARKPRTQQYSLAGNGIQIGQKFYSFQDFKTFSVGQDGAIASVVLTPLKRFMPPLTIYVAPDVAESVVSFLGNFLPFEQHKVDAVDGLLRRMRF